MGNHQMILIKSMSIRHLNSARCQTIPIPNESFVLAQMSIYWPIQGVIGGGCMLLVGSSTFPCASRFLGTSWRIFTGKWPRHKRANLPTSAFQASACVTSADIPLVEPKVKGAAPLVEMEGTTRAHDPVCMGWVNGAMTHSTTARTWSYLLYKKFTIN